MSSDNCSTEAYRRSTSLRKAISTMLSRSPRNVRARRRGVSRRAWATTSAVEPLAAAPSAISFWSPNTVLGLRGLVSQTIVAQSTGRSLDNS